MSYILCYQTAHDRKVKIVNMLSRQCNLPCLRVCHTASHAIWIKNTAHINVTAMLVENCAQFNLLFYHAICICILPSVSLNWSYTLRTAHQLSNVSYKHIVKSMTHTVLTNNPCQNPILIILLVYRGKRLFFPIHTCSVHRIATLAFTVLYAVRLCNMPNCYVYPFRQHIF